MQGTVIGTVSLLAALVALGGAVALAGWTRAHAPSLDPAQGGPQKLHREPIPRIGGLAVLLGLVAAACAQVSLGEAARDWWMMFLCIAPGFAWGLIEDLSKRGAVLVRLVLTVASAALGYVLLDARITFVDVPFLDSLLAVTALSFVFTVIAVSGVAHAINVIDGLNGLAAMTGVLACAGLALVSWMVGDEFVFAAASVLGASIFGFLLVNFPRGRIFLGDGGAYLIGLLLAVLSLLLVQRNTEVSPWFPLVLLAYPIWETLFSMSRRLQRGHSPGRADALHLHSLVYRRVLRSAHDSRPGGGIAANSLASLCLWMLPFLSLLAAISFWRQSLVLQCAALGFAALYGWLYRQLVRFRGQRLVALRRAVGWSAAGRGRLRPNG